MPTVKARFDGQVFIPEQPVNLPFGSVVEVTLPQCIPSPVTPVTRFADLYGILKGLSETTEEEIEAAKYRFDWEKWEKLHATEEGP